MAAYTPVQAESLGLRQGIHFYRIRSDKFKTARTDVFYPRPLSAAAAPAHAMVPAMLRRGCVGLPDALDVERRLEALYGASFDWQVLKKGDLQVVHMGMAHVADRYASGGERLFADSTALFLQLLHAPILENGLFREEVFRQERRNLLDTIRSRVNDKIRYASLRCVEEMFRGEAYAVHAEGGEPEALALDASQVTDAWRNLCGRGPAYVYFSGEMPEADILSFMDAFTQEVRPEGVDVPQTVRTFAERPALHVEEEMDVNQGKLCMGLRTLVAPDSSDWPALMVYNGILGGDLHSKLFQNVREKASLAYYASSRLERHKGLMFINSGIEAENREKAEAIIKEQMADMQRGAITSEEYDATLRSLATAFKAAQDNQFGIVDFFFGQHLLGTGDTYESLAGKVATVSLEDVVRVAQQIRLDTVYFLKPAGTEATADIGMEGAAQ